MTTILFVSHTGELNGAERLLLQLLRGLDRKKFYPVLTVPNEGELARGSPPLPVPSYLGGS